MANKIENTNINASQYLDASSRYLNSNVVYYSGNGKKVLTFDTYKRQAPITSTNDKFMVITGATQYRPDLVSNSKYGFPHYWWKIMEFNNIYDIYDFKIGVTIRLPEFV